MAVVEAAVEAWRMARARGDCVNEGRSVGCSLAEWVVVLVENGAAVAAEVHGAMRPGCRRMLIVRAGRSAEEANMAAV